MIQTLIHISVYQLLFLGIYELFLKRETFFTLNRIYLLVTPVLAMILPFAKLDFLRDSFSHSFLILLPEIALSDSSAGPEHSGIQVFPILKGIWFLGMGVFFLIFIYKLFKISRISKTGIRKSIYLTEIIEIPGSTLAFSFLNRIFIGRDLPEKLKEQIIEHEKAHLTEKHSWDLLFYEVLLIPLWFNPVLYVFRKRIEAVHEFSADRKVTSKTGKEIYCQNLLSAVFQTDTISFVNSFFNESLIKTRIHMLQKSQSATRKLFRYFLVLPVIAGIFVYTACTGPSADFDQEVQQIHPPLPPKPPMPPPMPPAPFEEGAGSEGAESISFNRLDQVPVFPGCTGTSEDRKTCMNDKIAGFVSENFNTALAGELNLSGIQRIMVQFKIDERGMVTDIRSRAAHPELEAEAARIIRMLPAMEPGQMNGKPVSVLYSLPIAFDIR